MNEKIHELEIRIAKLEGIIEGKEEVIALLKALLEKEQMTSPVPWTISSTWPEEGSVGGAIVGTQQINAPYYTIGDKVVVV